jgi:hypothetical protein
MICRKLYCSRSLRVSAAGLSVQQWEAETLIDVVAIDGRPLQPAGHECDAKGHEGLEFIDRNLAIVIAVGVL